MHRHIRFDMSQSTGEKNVIEIAAFITFHNSQLKEGLTFETVA